MSDGTRREGRETDERRDMIQLMQTPARLKGRTPILPRTVLRTVKRVVSMAECVVKLSLIVIRNPSRSRRNPSQKSTRHQSSRARLFSSHRLHHLSRFLLALFH